jgi:glycopeptide antibiotics resistance protein
MGKREVRVIVVRKWMTVTLLVLLSAGMLSLIWFLSGKAYSSEKRGVAEQVAVLLRIDAVSNAGVIAALMPLLADVIAFVPWGFLAFMIVTPARSSARGYALTCLAAAGFSLAMVLWQELLLPTRVTTWGDTIFTTAGALAGAGLGHLRRTLRVRFN